MSLRSLNVKVSVSRNFLLYGNILVKAQLVTKSLKIKKKFFLRNSKRSRRKKEKRKTGIALTLHSALLQVFPFMCYL